MCKVWEIVKKEELGELEGGISGGEGEIESGELEELMLRGVGISGGGREVGKGGEGGGDLLIKKEGEDRSKVKALKATGCGIVRRDT